MRTLLVAIFLIFYWIFSLPMYLILYIISKKSPQKRAEISQHIVVRAFKMILFICGVKITVKGLERVPEEGACLFVFNHRSYFDILAGYTTAPKYLGFVAKKEMQHIPCISHWMRFMHCLFLDRTNTKEGMKTVLKGIELLKSGHSIFIAPEGTRNHKSEMLKFKEGSLKMAEKAKVPVVPVAMSNMDSILEQHIPWIHKGHVIVEYCEPIRFEECEPEEKKHVGAMARQRIAEALERNAAEL